MSKKLAIGAMLALTLVLSIALLSCGGSSSGGDDQVTGGAYTITFQLHGGALAGVTGDSFTRESDENGKLAQADIPGKPSKDGEEGDWYEAATGGSPLNLAAKVFGAATTIHAQYSEPGDPNVTVTGVTVNPSAPTVARGHTQTFTATVQGEGGTPGQGVTWAVEGVGGTKDAGTTIGADGTLRVARAEALENLTVTATSTQDTEFSATATVTLNDPANVVLGVDWMGSARFRTADAQNPDAYFINFEAAEYELEIQYKGTGEWGIAAEVKFFPAGNIDGTAIDKDATNELGTTDASDTENATLEDQGTGGNTVIMIQHFGTDNLFAFYGATDETEWNIVKVRFVAVQGDATMMIALSRKNEDGGEPDGQGGSFPAPATTKINYVSLRKVLDDTPTFGPGLIKDGDFFAQNAGETNQDQRLPGGYWNTNGSSYGHNGGVVFTVDETVKDDIPAYVKF